MTRGGGDEPPAGASPGENQTATTGMAASVGVDAPPAPPGPPSFRGSSGDGRSEAARARASGAVSANDLGFGTRVAENSSRRLLNRNGSFNVVRTGRGARYILSPYQRLLAMTWGRFFSATLVFYLVANTVFALAYLAAGPRALQGPHLSPSLGAFGEFLRAFFFSVQTFATVGYGDVFPVSMAANVIVTLETLVGLVSVAIATGLVFARFSRPTAAIRYSREAVIAPFQGGTAFMFRCANERDNQLIEVTVRVTYVRTVVRGGRRVREFSTLPLEYDRVTFFALSWTVVHPIDQESPLFGCTRQDLLESEAEFLVLLSGTDDTFSQVVHSRTSYRADEILWGARFRSMFVESPEGGVTGMNLSRIDDVEPAGATVPV